MQGKDSATGRDSVYQAAGTTDNTEAQVDESENRDIAGTKGRPTVALDMKVTTTT